MSRQIYRLKKKPTFIRRRRPVHKTLLSIFHNAIRTLIRRRDAEKKRQYHCEWQTRVDAEGCHGYTRLGWRALGGTERHITNTPRALHDLSHFVSRQVHKNPCYWNLQQKRKCELDTRDCKKPLFSQTDKRINSTCEKRNRKLKPKRLFCDGRVGTFRRRLLISITLRNYQNGLLSRRCCVCSSL